MGIFICKKVKGHLPRSKDILGQVVRWVENVRLVSFEKEVRLEQILFVDITWEASCVHEVKDHIPKLKDIWGQIVR